MNGTIGYKQYQEHFNAIPEIKNEINELSLISTSRRDPNAKKTSDVNTFLKQPVKYYFDVTTRDKNVTTLFHHAYYYDKAEDAEKAHHMLRLKLYDQEVEPFMKKINKGKKLTETDQSRLQAIMQRMDKFISR